MQQYMILTCVGKDRPGIADDITTFLFERQANIEDSHMAVMGGRFSVMVLFSGTADQLLKISAETNRLENIGLEVSLHEAEDPSARKAKPALPLVVEVTAMDHPGIVQQVVHILRRFDVNVLALNTRVTQAPLSGTPLFNLDLQAAVPAGAPIARVKTDLEDLAADMNLDLVFR